MRNRILLNLALAFIIIPLCVVIRDYIQVEVFHDHKVFSGTFQEYYQVQRVYNIFLFTPILCSIVILIPYNFVLTYIGKKLKINLLQKIVLLNFIFIIAFCLLGTFINVWSFPLWKNLKYLYYFLPVSILIASPLHFFVDRKEKVEY